MTTKPQGKEKKVKAWAILNIVGDFWSPRAFPSELEAKQYLKKFCESIKRPEYVKRMKVVQVEVSYSLPTKKAKKK